MRVGEIRQFCKLQNSGQSLRQTGAGRSLHPEIGSHYRGFDQSEEIQYAYLVKHSCSLYSKIDHGVEYSFLPLGSDSFKKDLYSRVFR